MKLAHWHRSQGHTVTLTKRRPRDLFDPSYGIVYASAIFSDSRKFFPKIKSDWPDVIFGGTGTTNPLTVESIIGTDYEFYDYQDYPDFKESIGFTKRGCRLSCKFCVVPEKEGKPYFVNSINDIWRGGPYPRKLHLLDNDFFGHESWREHIREIIDGNFQVCLSQGINVRMITTETAEALASIQRSTGIHASTKEKFIALGICLRTSKYSSQELTNSKRPESHHHTSGLTC
jgi:hypothetical protein